MTGKTKIYTPCILVILDGWGIAAPTRGNAICSAKTPFFDSLVERYPTAVLQASGEAAGLPWSHVGNSEVGHMSIGAGRIVYQDFSRINNAIADRSFFSNPAFLDCFSHVAGTGGMVHIIGMASTSGVHSHIDHLLALCELADKQSRAPVMLHLFLDGRDAPYASGSRFIRAVCEHILPTKIRIASLSGRQYAMDRDNHWERTEKAYRAIAEGVSDKQTSDPVGAIEQSYAEGVYDEEFVPTVITKDGVPVASVHDGDAIIFFNIRADRTRQLTRCFLGDTFDRFARVLPQNLHLVTMTEYDESFPVVIAYPPLRVEQTLSECISAQGYRQLHIGETEKYAHITYFLNNGREQPLTGEDRIMIPSARIESYAEKPSMSASEITDAVVNAVQQSAYQFVAINFANADMVGHTGDRKATIAAIEVLDRCMKRIVDAVIAHNGAVIITADHGNAEELLDLHTGQINKEHSNNPVPCVIIAHDLEGRSLNINDVGSRDLHILEPHGMLSDVAPTLLSLLGIPQPPEMTGKNLLTLL